MNRKPQNSIKENDANHDLKRRGIELPIISPPGYRTRVFHVGDLDAPTAMHLPFSERQHYGQQGAKQFPCPFLWEQRASSQKPVWSR